MQIPWKLTEFMFHRPVYLPATAACAERGISNQGLLSFPHILSTLFLCCSHTLWRVVFLQMLNVILFHYQVFRRIILTINIQMVNYFYWSKVATQSFFHDQSMFSDVTQRVSIGMVRFKNKDVSITNSSSSWFASLNPKTIHVAQQCPLTHLQFFSKCQSSQPVNDIALPKIFQSEQVSTNLRVSPQLPTVETAEATLLNRVIERKLGTANLTKGSYMRHYLYVPSYLP